MTRQGIEREGTDTVTASLLRSFFCFRYYNIFLALATTTLYPCLDLWPLRVLLHLSKIITSTRSATAGEKLGGFHSRKASPNAIDVSTAQVTISLLSSSCVKI